METFETSADRFFKGPKHTVSHFYIEGTYYCDILEDVVRELGANGEGKIKGETAIPAGRYEIVMAMSPTFKRMMPYLRKVPFFSSIMMHWGNIPLHTKGCLLMGKNTEKGKVTNSKAITIAWIERLEKELAAGKRAFITIK